MKYARAIAPAGSLVLSVVLAGALVSVPAPGSVARADEASDGDGAAAAPELQDQEQPIDPPTDDELLLDEVPTLADIEPSSVPNDMATPEQDASEEDPSLQEGADEDAGDQLLDPSDLAREGEAEAPAENVLESQPVVEAAQTGAFAVTGGVYGTDYTYANSVLTVLTSTPITIAMAEPGATTTTDSIVVKSPSMANVTIESLSIDRSATGNETHWGTAAFDVQSGGVSLTIKGINTLKSGALQAGIQSGSGKNYQDTSYPIVIDGMNDMLYVYGGYQAAGIGSGYQSASEGGVTIDGGYIYAYGGYQGAGIGGSSWAWGSNITVQDLAHVTARGGEGAAGIGGGYAQLGTNITLYNSVVQATGGAGAAAVGNGDFAHGKAAAIVVDGATLTAVAGSDAAAIGGGKGSGAYGLEVKDGYLKLERGSGAEYIGRGSGSAVTTERAITGGYFVVGDEHNNTVYGMAVAPGYQVENITHLHLDEFYDYHVIPASISEEPPTLPEGPAEPEQPAQPEQPTEPVRPAQPQAPVAPQQPAQSVKPTGAQVPKTGDATGSFAGLAAVGAFLTGVASALWMRVRRAG